MNANEKPVIVSTPSGGSVAAPKEPMAYIGRKDCGCVVAACIDDKEHPEYTAEDLKEFAIAGYAIERVTCEQARQMLTGCKCNKPQNVQSSGTRDQPA
jgi:hypothetical protein